MLSLILLITPKIGLQMGLIDWLTDIFGPLKPVNKNGVAHTIQAKLRATVSAIRHSEDLQAMSDQRWEDLLFRERFFNMRCDEEYKKLEYESRTGNKHEGTLGEPVYPPYTVWHKGTAKYTDPAIIEKEWEDYNLTYRK